MHHEEQICETILNFGSVVQEMLFKRFLIWSSGSPPVWQSRKIYAILKEDIIGEHLCGIWTSGSGGNAVKRCFLSRALAAPLFSGPELNVQFK